MNVREMMAWLYPRGMRYEHGQGGGVPELTPIDVAAALGVAVTAAGITPESMREAAA